MSELKINNIYKGDSLEILKTFPSKCVDLIFADPPYNMQLKNDLYRPNNTKVDGVNDEWDKFSSFKEYDNFCISWLRECKRVLKDTGSIWVIGSYHNIYRVGNIMLNLGYWILNDVTWYKTNPMPRNMNLQFVNSTECWIYFINNGTSGTFNNNGSVKHDFLESSVCPMSEKKFGKHPTQKPLKIIKELIECVTNPNDIVLDPFMGSGTTCVASSILKRRYIGIELSEDYYETAKLRINNL